eukprot:scaffold12.g8234.t1
MPMEAAASLLGLHAAEEQQAGAGREAAATNAKPAAEAASSPPGLEGIATARAHDLAVPSTAGNADATAARPTPLQQRDQISEEEEAEAVAALAAAAADSEGAEGGGGEEAEAEDDPGQDPDWQAGTKPRGRGRTRKRRPLGGRRGGEAGPLPTCAHCGTHDTPRWWKDNFPIGMLCNACGIWLKRHGYPRPVQFFVSSAGAAPAGAAPAGAAPAAPPPGVNGGAASAAPALLRAGSGLGSGDLGAAASSGQQQQPADVEFYIINGRPKRRKKGAAAAAAAAPAAHATAQSEDGGAGLGPAAGSGAAHPAAAAADPPINFEAAGDRVFVIRRKLLRAPSIGTAASGSADATPAAAAAAPGGLAPPSPAPPAEADVVAALVHVGWAPAARAAHQMYERVVAYGEASAQVAGTAPARLLCSVANATHSLDPPSRPPSVVDDFELLGDCKATATLALRPGMAVASWDALVRHFVAQL